MKPSLGRTRLNSLVFNETCVGGGTTTTRIEGQLGCKGQDTTDSTVRSSMKPVLAAAAAWLYSMCVQEQHSLLCWNDLCSRNTTSHPNTGVSTHSSPLVDWSDNVGLKKLEIV